MRILKYVVIAVFAAIFLGFAFANREFVTIYFDPLGGASLPPVEAPEFVVVLVAIAVGVIAGSVATWIRHGSYRRRARMAEAQVARLRDDLQSARAVAVTPGLPLARQA